MILEIELDAWGYKNIEKPNELDNLLQSKIKDNKFKYIFIDEIQNVKGFEKVIESYRLQNNYSIFITGSNSYLLSGELVTKLTGRKIEIEMLPLNFYEYLEMKKFQGKSVTTDLNEEFASYIRDGGFPGALKYEQEEDKRTYVLNIIKDIFEKDVKKNEKIKSIETFESIEKFIVNNFGSMSSISSIKSYYKSINKKIDQRTIERYIQILENAKIIYPCEIFDMKSKSVLKGEKKYYLADLSIYYALNTDNRINYGPVLENVLHNYLKSKGYSLSVGRIGKLEIDFIARHHREDYYYLQVSKTIEDQKTEEREYRPFYEIKEMYPRYLFVADFILQENVNGIKNVNIMKFIANNEDLK